MPSSVTFTGSRFEYEGTLPTGLIVFPLARDGRRTGTIVRISPAIIQRVQQKVTESGAIRMGACRDNPSPHSLGEMLMREGHSPQFLSYILPLLQEQLFLIQYRMGNAIWVRKRQ